VKTGIAVLAATLMSFAALAAHHGSAEDEVRAASEAFDRAYATNDVEGYFGAPRFIFPGQGRTCPPITNNGLQ
jgi:hypothetical protein